MALDPARRPLATRSRAWAQALARALVRARVSPNFISLVSIAFAAFGAWLLARGASPLALVGAAICTQLRLLCNLMDGMVAIEGGRQTPSGALYNELPDRIADSLLLVALGYAIERVELGWFAALLAALTAYIRVLGGSFGLAQDFRGPQAKPHRMAVLTAGCLAAALESTVSSSSWSLHAATWTIVIGSVWTCAARTRAIAAQLRARSTP